MKFFAVDQKVCLVELDYIIAKTQGSRFNIREIVLDGSSGVQIESNALELFTVNQNKVALSVKGVVFLSPSGEMRITV